ncbi:DUF4405 domain-containing protein [Gemmatimonadota bacterium]
MQHRHHIERGTMVSGKRFKPRIFTALALSTTGLVLAFTGIICYLKPPSRIAAWIGWRFLGLEKSAWEALHTVFALLFVIAALTHVTYNRKALWAYMRLRLKQGRQHWRELAAASGITAAFVLITLLNIFPVKPIMDLGDRLSEGWGADNKTPAISRIETFPLVTYCRLMEIDLATAMHQLALAGYEGVSPETTVSDIARTNGVPPIEIGRLLETWVVPSPMDF